MEPKSEIKLFRAWFSSYCTRVEIALKVKGIPYECIEEDLTNKSELLLKYNPPNKTVPVLLHNGKPIAESLIILEYIDDCWKNRPKLLPDEPYERAKVRYWATYYDQKFMSGIVKIATSSDTGRGKAVEEFSEMIKVLEEGIARDFPRGTSLYSHNSLGFLDVVVASSGCNYRAFFEAFRMAYPEEKNKEFFSWVKNLKEHRLVRDTLPQHDALVAKIKKKFGLESEDLSA